jgi:DsbC/DsbD-like thiol-disulfide interchange protein
MRHLSVSLRFLFLLVLVLIPVPGARASAASIPHGSVDLVAENQWIAPGRQTYFGLNFQLEKGWHIYWINPGDSGQPPRTLPANGTVRIVAELSVLVCREICVPGKTQISLSLPIESTASAPDTRGNDLFTAARKSLPRKPPDDWKFSVNNKKYSFVLIANAGRQITRAAFFPLAESQIDNSAPQLIVPTATGFQLTLRSTSGAD